MKEITGDLFITKCDAICITTNGYVKKDGTLVMGRGVAKQAVILYPMISKIMGDFVKIHGNCVGSFNSLTKHHKLVFNFPVKHHWWEKANINLIIASVVQLNALINLTKFKKILIPKPGCGNGKLKWEDVKKEIEPLLDDRFYIIDKL